VADLKLVSQSLIDGFGQGILVFDISGNLVASNQAASTMLGSDLTLIRSDGWNAVSVLFNSRVNDPNETIDAARDKAETTGKPVRFRTFRSGQHIPCWASAVKGEDGKTYIMITLEVLDWTPISEIVEKFSSEVKDAIETTQGHMDIIAQSVKRKGENDTVEAAGKRISGFVKLISTHMHRVGRLISMLERLEVLRVGRLPQIMKDNRRKVSVEDFLEDLLEGLDSTRLLDPETPEQDVRARVTTNAPDNLKIAVPPAQLTVILQDILRNAIMYSMKATPIKITVKQVGDTAQIDVVDEGYGVRTKEVDTVFTPFKRAKQPQIISEFGYGLSLYLCKHELEAMGGRMWFKSEEGVGTTFSLSVPLWKDDATVTSTQSAVSSSSSASTS
jgi:signal transduction histidine kinase